MAVIFGIPRKFPVLKLINEGIMLVFWIAGFLFLIYYGLFLSRNLIVTSIILIMWAFFSWTFFLAFLETIRNTKKLSSFYKIVFLDGNKLKFRENIKFEFGTFRIESYFDRRYDYSTKTYRSVYITNVDFKPEGILEGSELDLKKFRNKKYKICIGSDGEGLCILPGLRVYSEKWEGIYLLIVPSSNLHSEGHVELSLTYKNNHAKLRASLRKDGLLKGEIYWKKGERVRSVKVEIECEGKREIVARSRRAYFQFFKRFFVKDDVVIISSREFINCKEIKSIFGKDSLILGRGTFKMRLVFDIPLAFDKFKEAYIKV